jgi:hypothetical protein
MRRLTVCGGLLAGVVLLGLAGPASGAFDSTALLFDDTKVYQYELWFYTADWVDSLEYYKNLDERYIPARFLWRRAPGDSVAFDSIGVRYKGNSSYSFAGTSPKKPFKFKFDEYRGSQNLCGTSRLNFSNGARDPSQMREKISYDIIRTYMPAPRAAYATITIAGQLIGFFTQVEQVDKTFLTQNYADNDRNLFKSGDDGANLGYLGQNQSSYEPYYELKTNETVNDWWDLIVMIDKLNNTPDSTFTRVVGSYLDLDRCARYLAFNQVFSNFDSYTGSGRNYYLYNDNGRMTVIPWDLNLSFGDYTNNWNVITASISAPSNLAQRPLNHRIMANDSLRRIYLGYIEDMIDGPAAAESIAVTADRIKAFIDPWVQADSHKLHTYADFVTNVESDVTLLQGPTRIVMPGIKSFMTKRIASLRSQLTALPVADRQRRTVTAAAALAVRAADDGRVTFVYAVDGKNACPVRITVFDCRGQAVAALDEGTKTAGTYTCAWDARAMAAGCYVIQLNIAPGVPVKMMVVH